VKAGAYKVLAAYATSEGLPAVEALLGALPQDLGVPVAVACERDPDGRDALLRRLSAASRLQIVEPDDKDELEAGRVYLAPAGYHLVLDRGALALSCDDEPAPSPGALFDSAADSFGAGALALLLCGEQAPAGAEGALTRVREGGGLALRGGAETFSALLAALTGHPAAGGEA
jgi:two-component system chemotaxis response regulator CheB